MKEVLWFAHPRFIFMTLHFLLFLTPTLTPTNKKLRVAINQKITGLKLEYTNLNSLQFHMEDLPFIKLVNLYLIENLSLNDQRILLMKRRFPKIRFNTLTPKDPWTPNGTNFVPRHFFTPFENHPSEINVNFVLLNWNWIDLYKNISTFKAGTSKNRA